MLVPWSVKISLAESIILSDSAIQSLHDSLFCRCCRQRHGLILLSLLPPLFSVLQLLVVLFLTPFDPFSSVWHQSLRSSASSSQLSGLMPVSFRSHLQASLKHKAGWPARRCPVASLLYMTSFGMRLIVFHFAHCTQGTTFTYSLTYLQYKRPVE